MFSLSAYLHWLDVLWSLLLFVHLLYFTVACLSLHSVSKIIMEYWWKTIIKERKEWDRCMVLVRRPYFRIDWGGVFQFLTRSILLSYTWVQDGNCTPKCEYLNTHKNVKLTPKVHPGPCPTSSVLPVCLSPLLMSANTKIFKCWSVFIIVFI